MNIFFKKGNGGFTILETMVAVTLFTIIVTVGIGAMLNVNLARKKTESQRAVMDNLSFIMEDMSRNIRLGQMYHCLEDDNLSSIATPNDCPTSSRAISVEPFNGSLDTTGDQLIYQFIHPDSPDNGILQKSTNGGDSFLSLTPTEVIFDWSSSGFTVIGSEPSPEDFHQPRVIIRLVGRVVVPGTDVESPFNLQTTVSMRLVDN